MNRICVNKENGLLVFGEIMFLDDIVNMLLENICHILLHCMESAIVAILLCALCRSEDPVQPLGLHYIRSTGKRIVGLP
jgi:hypothetical protein